MNIVYFKTHDSTFILKDQNILENNFNTDTYLIKNTNSLTYVLAIIRLCLFLLFKSSKYDLFFIRFADWHAAILSVFKTIYRKKLIIVIGGYDVASIPELNYGVHIKKLRSRAVTYSFRKADLLLPNHFKLIKYENSFGLDKTYFGGILTFVEVPEEKIKVLFNGYDSDKFKLGNTVKEDLALMVVNIDNERTYRIKGVKYFIEAAKHIPEKKFCLIGISNNLIETKKESLPENLEILKFLLFDELLTYFRKAKVFCIFSLSEGMPNVLCESMLCECIPVGSNVSSIPDIIGENGFLISNTHPEHIKEQIINAFNAPAQMGIKARNFIRNNFPLEKREKELVGYINQLQ